MPRALVASPVEQLALAPEGVKSPGSPGPAAGNTQVARVRERTGGDS